jgi:hypothetical protein
MVRDHGEVLELLVVHRVVPREVTDIDDVRLEHLVHAAVGIVGVERGHDHAPVDRRE